MALVRGGEHFKFERSDRLYFWMTQQCRCRWCRTSLPLAYRARSIASVPVERHGVAWEDLARRLGDDGSAPFPAAARILAACTEPKPRSSPRRRARRRQGARRRFGGSYANLLLQEAAYRVPRAKHQPLG